MEADDLFVEDGPSGLLTRLNRVGLLLDAFQHRCFDEFGLRFIDYSVMRVLQLTGPPYEITPTRLSEIVVRSTGGMTQIIDRLERDALVARAPDAHDRRKVIVALTPAGLELTEKANAAYLERKAQLLESLSPEELDQLEGPLRRLLAVLSEDHQRAKR